MHLIQRISKLMLLVAFLAGCGSLPDDMEHTVIETQSTTAVSTLSKLSDTYFSKQSGQSMSAISIQDNGWQALSQRLALVEAAEHSIDIQYYIWNSDESGHYLASRLMAAADRGVQVRVMLDDINLNEREDLLIALDAHPQVEIRVFNPIPNRRGVSKWLRVLGDFTRLNRRMHNKSFTVDSAFSVVGGRNIGDEYFDLSDEINFRDRDALVTGAVVTDIQTSFDEYWDSRWSYPVELLGGDSASYAPIFETVRVPQYQAYPELPDGRENGLRLLDNVVNQMNWVNAYFVYDKPVPLDENDSDTPKTTAKLLAELARQSDQEIVLESAYLIFDDHQLERIQLLSDDGVEIKALTNSMASNDLVTNHSGYAARREEILKHGVQLFELKPDTKLCEGSTKDEFKCAPTVPYGLHSKSIVFDRNVAGIGSFNFNLRSTYLNTESILIIENQQVADDLAVNILDAMDDDNSWNLDLTEGQIRWHSGEETWENEPETGQWERIKSGLLQLLPIEKYL